MNQTQRARANRHKRRLPVRVFPEEGPPIQGFTGNISRSGLFIASRRGTAKGRQIRIEVLLPSTSTVSMTARVVWLRRAHEGLDVLGQGGLGVQVIEPPSEWTTFLTGLEHTPKPET